MAKQRRAQVDVAVGADTSGAKTSIEDLKKSIDGMGEGGQKAAKAVERALDSMANAIKRATTANQNAQAELVAGNRANEAFFEESARIRGLDIEVHRNLLTALGQSRVAYEALLKVKQETQAADQRAAAQTSYLDKLREEVALYGKSAAELKRYEAAKLGVGAAAEPLLLQLQAQKKAHEDAAVAARAEADALRESIAAKKSLESQQQSYLAGLREQIALQNKSAEDAMRYKAAQLGVGADAAPLILQLQNQRAAQKLAADAARDEAAAQREVAAAKKAAETQQASFLASLKSQTDAIGKTRVDLLEMQAAQMGLTAQAAPFIAKLRESEGALLKSGIAFDKYGLSAKQTAAALRQVPAQLTDIFVSLQGGQAPLTVLLQQGGQLKDIFGGIVPAAKALGGALLGLINPYTILAGTIGGLVYGYNKGADEALAFQKTLISTGNAAGVSAGQMGLMAATLDRIGGGTQSKAAEVLNQMAAAGVRGAANMQRFTSAAIEFERAGGGAIEKTVETFKELERAPLQASIKLNESMNYLTRSTYDQIKALEDQGRATEAAAAAQEVYASALESRTPEMLANLGHIERAWLAIKSKSAEAIDELLKVGRTDLGSRLSAISDLIRIEREAAGIRPGDQRTTPRIEGLKQEQALLQEQFRIERQLATQRGDAAEQVKAEIRLEQSRLKYLDDRKRKELEIAKIVGEAAATLPKDMSAEQRNLEARRLVSKEIAAIEKRYTKSGSKSDYERELERQNKLINELSGVTSDFDEELLRLYATKQRLRLSDEQYVKLVEALIQKQPFARDLAKQQADAEKERAKAIKEANDAQAKNLAGLDKQIEGNEKTLDGLREELIGITMGKQARAEAIAQRYEEAAAQAEQNAQLAYMGDFNEYEKLMKIAEGLRAVAAERRKITSATTMKEIEEANEKAAKKAQDDWEKASDQIGQSLADSLMEGGKSAAEYIKDLFRTMVLRPVIQAVVQPFANGVNTAINAGGSALTNYAGSALSMLTGSSGWGGLNLSGTVAAAGNYGAVYSGAAYGTGFGTQQSAMLAAQEAGMVSSAGGASATTISIWAAAIAAGVYKANQDWNEGYRRDQARDVSQSVWGGGGLLGDLQPMGGLEETKADFFSMLGFSDKWADLLSGATAVSKLFGRAAPRVTGTGIQGTIGAGDFTGQAYADIYEKGGLFRSSKSYQQFEQLPDEINRFLDAAASGIFDKAKEYGEALGLPVDALSGITTELKEQIGSDAEANKTAIMESLASYGDALVAGWAEAIAPLAFYGETTTQTIERVAGAIIATNKMLDLLGISALEASIEGGKAAQALAEMFGGLEGIAQAASVYYEQFYSDGEKALTSARQVSEALDDVGLSLPQTRTEFRRLVEGLDLTTDSGRRQFAVLMQVSGAFAELTPLLEGVGNGLEEGIAKLKDLEDGLAKILGTMAKSIQETLSDLIDNLTSLQDFRTSLQDAAAGYRLAGMQPNDRITALQAQETILFAQLGGATDPVAVAEKLQGVIIQRIQEEAALRQSLEDDIYRTAQLAREEQIKTLREQIQGYERLRDIARSVSEFTASLKSSDLSPLSFADQLAASRSLFDQTVAGARSGDVFAAQNLTGNAQAFLNEARQYYGSSSAYADIFSQVTNTLDELAAAGMALDPQVAALQDQLTQLEMMNDAQQRIIESNTEIAVALDRVDAALGERENQMAVAVQEQIALAKQEIEEQRAINEALQAQITQAAAGYSSVNQNLVELGFTLNEIAAEIGLNRMTPQNRTTTTNRV